MSADNKKIAVVAGDGIGPEVINAAWRVVSAAAEKSGAGLERVDFPLGADLYLKTGEVMPFSMLDEMGETDAMFLGAIGDPRVKPGILERGILLRLRFHFDQYINLRPARSLPGVPTPVPLKTPMDSVVVRENTEDLYMGMGAILPKNGKAGKLDAPLSLERGLYTLNGRLEIELTPRGGTSKTPAFSAAVAMNTAPAVERITRYACELAKKRGENRVTVVSKSNAAPQLYGFFEETARPIIEAAGLEYAMVNVDAICYHLVRSPSAYGVLLCPNLFGDIVSDLQAGLAGGLGTAAGGNIGDGLSMFEPVHGSAPDIAGTGRANPIASIMAGALMLSHVGMDKAAAAVEGAVMKYLEDAGAADMPYEFGGEKSCDAVGDAVLKNI